MPLPIAPWSGPRFIRVAAALGLGVLCSCSPKRTEGVAIVNAVVITEKETALALRSALWRRDESWNSLSPAMRQQRSREALDELIDQCLLKELANPRPATAGREGEEDFQQFLKQFDPPDSWRKRAEMQGLTEAALVDYFVDQAAQLRVIEEHLPPTTPAAREAAAGTWFEAHRKEFVLPERVHASHIFLIRRDFVVTPRDPADGPLPGHQAPAGQEVERDRSEEIRAIHGQLLRHEATFAELADKYSDDERTKKQGGDLGWFSRARIPRDFADAVFALTPGQISEPFLTKLGWHIVWVQEKLSARPATFDEVKGEIMALLETQEREIAVKHLLKDLRAHARITIDEARLENAGKSLGSE